MMELLFLGTGASVPSRDRATSCIAVRSGSDIILMDCGEGSQRQLMISPFSFMRIKAILITHLHGDHVFGLPGLLQTMSLSGRKEHLTVYGPTGIKGCVDAFMTVTEGETVYPLEVCEVSGGEEFAVGDLTVSVYRTEHNIASVGYTVREKDRPGKLDREKALSLGIGDGPDMARLKNGVTVGDVTPQMVLGPSKKGESLSYTGDTVPCQSVIDGSRDVTVLIHECTYMASETNLAKKHKHSTAIQAAEDALSAGASHLILTHVSNRYDELSVVVDEARTIFENTVAANDMDLFEIRNGGMSLRPRAERSSHQLAEFLPRPAFSLVRIWHRAHHLYRWVPHPSIQGRAPQHIFAPLLEFKNDIPPAIGEGDIFGRVIEGRSLLNAFYYSQNHEVVVRLIYDAHEVI